MSALERMRDAVAENQRLARLGVPTDCPPQAHRRPLTPLAQQLDLDGGLHDLQPPTRQERLFEPAPFAQLDGQQHLDTEREERSDDR